MKRKTNPLERKKLFKIVYWTVLILFVTSTLIFGRYSLLKVYKAEREINRLQEKVDTLMIKNERLQNENQELKTNPLTVEKIAREQLGYQKTGEKVYRFLPPATEDKKKVQKE
jgi:cell division protein FtsB